MSPDAHREAKGDQGRQEAVEMKPRCYCRSDQDIAEVPCRIRRVEHRDPVAPLTGGRRVPRWALSRWGARAFAAAGAGFSHW